MVEIYREVPVSDIERLEKARCMLVKGKTPIELSLLSPVTEAMWEITHRRYKEVIVNKKIKVQESSKI